MNKVESGGANQLLVQHVPSAPETGELRRETLLEVLNGLSHGARLPECMSELWLPTTTRDELRSGIARLTGADTDEWLEASKFHPQTIETRAVWLGFEKRLLQFNRASGVYRGLTPGARQIWLLAAEGYSNRQISQKSGFTEGTIKVAKSRTLKTIEARTPAHAVRRAYELGVLVLPASLEATS